MIRRLLRLYWRIIQFQGSVALQFRFDFLFRIIMDVGYYVMMFGFFGALFLHVDSLAGWNREQVFVFTASLLMIDAIFMVTLGESIYQLTHLVRGGGLDYLLVRPVPVFFFATLRYFSVNSAINAMIVALILGYTLASYSGPISFIGAVGYVVLMFFGYVVLYCLRVIAAIPVFWTGTNYGFNEVFHSLLQFSERPHTLLKGWARRVLTTIAPFSVIASFPVTFLFDPTRYDIILQMSVVTLYVVILCRYVWRAGLAQYSSASS